MTMSNDQTPDEWLEEMLPEVDEVGKGVVRDQLADYKVEANHKEHQLVVMAAELDSMVQSEAIRGSDIEWMMDCMEKAYESSKWYSKLSRACSRRLEVLSKNGEVIDDE